MIAAPNPLIPAALLVVIAVAFTVRTVWLRQALGRSPIAFAQSDSAHDLLGRVFRVVIVVGYLWYFARLAWRSLESFAGSIDWLIHPIVGWSGIAIMGLAALLIIAGQIHMGASWRIGIDSERTELVTVGLFGLSRNPVFLGILLVLVGGFLVAPSAVTAALLSAGSVALSVQIRLEEAELDAVHGEAYRAYRAKVRRWI